MRDWRRQSVCPHCGKMIEQTVYYSIEQVMEITGWSYVTVYRHRLALGGVKRCGRWRFARGKLESYLEKSN